MNQSTTFTTANLQWYSTPWSEVAYELTEKNSNRSFILPMETTSTRNTTSKPLQADQAISLEE